MVGCSRWRAGSRRPPRLGRRCSTNVLRDLGSWDGIWYRSIAVHGYDPPLVHGNNAGLPAALPGLPWAAHRSRWFIDLMWVGAALSTLLLAVGMCLLYRLTDDRLGRAIARRTVLYLSISPLAFVFSAVYAESLFLVLAVGAFLLVERRRFRAACVARRARRARPPGRDGARAGARLWMAGGTRGSCWTARRCPVWPRAAARWPRSCSCATCGGAPATRSRHRTRRRAAGDARACRSTPCSGTDVHGPGAGTATSCASSSTSSSRSSGRAAGRVVERRDEVPIQYLLFAAGVRAAAVRRGQPRLGRAGSA